MFLASSQILIEMFSSARGVEEEDGGGWYSEAFQGVGGGEAVLIALKVTRLKRPTLTRYPHCRQQARADR